MELPALAIQNPQFNVAAQADQARAADTADALNQQKQQAQQIELLAAGAAHALPNGIDGPVDEKKWNEVLDSYEAVGMPRDKMEALRKRPDLAPVLLKSSAAALAAQNDQKLFPLKVKELEASIAEHMAAASKSTLQEISPGATLHDVSGKVPDYTAPANPTGELGMYQQYVDGETAAGRTPLGPLEYQQALKGNGVTVTGPDGSTIQVGGPPAKGVNAFEVDEGKRLSKLSGEIADEGRKAATTKGTLSMMKQLLGNDQVYTGIGASQVQALKRAAVGLGLADADSVQDTETFNALSRQSALDVMGGSLGTGFSNADRDFVIEQVPNLGNTKEGNLKLIDIQTKIAQRKQEIAKFAAGYKKEHDNRLDAGFEDALADWAEEHPLFEEAGKAAPAAADTSAKGPKVDDATPPSGVTEDEWSVMTPEDKKLWAN